MKKILEVLVVAFLGGAIALGGYKLLIEQPQVVAEKLQEPSIEMVKANYTPNIINTASAPTDFTDAAEKTIHSVVHVKNTAVREVHSPFDYFFGGSSSPRKQQQVGTGSGVIISSDGYIITNNHVIDGATELEITLNNRKKYKAELIGADKNSDIALLKINADEALEYIPFGNSDNAKVGEWVLAVGNPYNLNSTVTAGIISAKGRDLQGNTNIDAFIQTDAAVNPGNSGGALVNTRGELVGINTAITSKTGSFIGYSFAVPSNIAKKIIDDLLEFGNVQEALIGIESAINEEGVNGVVIKAITEDGGAQKAGLQKGDIIKKINNVSISKFSELRGQLSAKRPGEKVVVTINRNGDELEKLVTLKKRDVFTSVNFGVNLKDLTAKDKKKFGVEYGAKIVGKPSNKGFRYYNVGEGYVLTKINGKNVKSANEPIAILNNYTGNQRMYLEMLNPKGELERYRF